MLTNKFSKTVLILIAGLTIYLLYLLSLHKLSLGVPGIGQWQWFWRTNAGFGSRELFLIIISVCLGFLIAYILERAKRSKIIKILAIFLLIGIYFSLIFYLYNTWEMVMWIRRHGDLPYFIYAHDQQKTLIIDIIRQYLPSVITNHNPKSSYEIFRSALGTHPPGSMMLFVFADRLTQLFWPAGPKNYMNFSYHVIWIMMSFNIIPILGLAWLVKLISNNWQKALRAVSFFVLLPSFIFFFLSPSALETTAVIYGLIFLILAIKAENKLFWLYLIITSLIFAFSTFVNFGLLTLYLLVGIVLLIFLLFKKIIFKKALIIFLTCLAVLISWTYVADWFFNYNYFVGWEYSQITHHDMIGKRLYFPWVYMDIYDFFMFFSFPLTFLFLFFIPKIVKNKKFFSIATMITAVLTLALIDISGVARGEVARIWLFLTPLFIIPIALILDDYKNSFITSAVCYSLILIQLVVMNTFIFVVNFPY